MVATTTARARAVARPAAAVLGAEWLWVAALVTASAVLRWAVARDLPAPWIFVDELLYAEMAHGLAEHGARTLRDVPVGNQFGLVYPLLLAPSYRLFDAMPEVYAAMKLTNAVVMSAAAVPAYLLARRLASPPWALVAALLTVATPNLAYSGTLMTENAFYPGFALVALALVRALERPTWLRAVLLVAAIGLAFLVRVQAAVLVPAAAAAPVALTLLEGGGLRRLARYGRVYGALGGATLAALLWYAAQGRSPRDALGAYSVVTSRGYDLGEVARWALYHLAELDLAVGVAPLAALLLLAAVARSERREVQAFTAAAVVLTGALLVQVAAFASLPTVQRVEERNLFHVMPLLFVALVAWLAAGAPRPRGRALAVCLAVALLPLVLPFERLVGVPAISDTFGLLPWWDLYGEGYSFTEVGRIATAVAAVVAAVVLLAPAHLVRLLPVVVVLYLAAEHQAVHGRIEREAVGSRFQALGREHSDWVDRAADGRGEVVAVWSGRAGVDFRVILVNEFFNRSIGRVFNLGAPLPGGLPESTLAADESGVLRDPAGSPVEASYVLTDASVSLVGDVVARDPRPTTVLYRLRGPAQLTHTTDGLYPDGWSGPVVRYTRLDCRGGRLVATVQADGGLFNRPQTVRASSGRHRLTAVVDPAATKRVVVPLAESGGRCEATFRVSPTAVPARVAPGATDERELGMHFLRFDYARR